MLFGALNVWLVGVFVWGCPQGFPQPVDKSSVCVRVLRARACVPFPFTKRLSEVQTSINALTWGASTLLAIVSMLGSPKPPGQRVISGISKKSLDR